MSVKKYIGRLKQMDYLIRTKSTGNPRQFAEKLNISRRTLLTNIQELRSLGCHIDYCRFSESYIYENESSILKIFEKK